jgi:hypothetical protein
VELAVTDLTAQDRLILRAIRDRAFRRDTPHEPLTLNGVEPDRHHLYALQERGLIVLDHVHPPTLTLEGRMKLDMIETSL